MAETDLERFVEAPGRDEKIKQVREMIDAKGIEYLYLQFVSVTGKIMGKGIPADHWESVAKKGFQLVYGATVNLFTDRAGNYLGYGPEAAELVGIPEPGNLHAAAVGTQPSGGFTARCSATARKRRIRAAILTSDCRGNLRRMHEEFTEEARHQAAHRHRAGDDVAEVR